MLVGGDIGGGDGDGSCISGRFSDGLTVDVDDPRNVRVFSDCLRLLPSSVGGRGGTLVDGVTTDRLSTSDGLSSRAGVLSCLSSDGRDGNLPAKPDDRRDVRREVFIVVSSAVSSL